MADENKYLVHNMNLKLIYWLTDILGGHQIALKVIFSLMLVYKPGKMGNNFVAPHPRGP